jgi:hypothetical protein
VRFLQYQWRAERDYVPRRPHQQSVAETGVKVVGGAFCGRSGAWLQFYARNKPDIADVYDARLFAKAVRGHRPIDAEVLRFFSNTPSSQCKVARRRRAGRFRAFRLMARYSYRAQDCDGIVTLSKKVNRAVTKLLA